MSDTELIDRISIFPYSSNSSTDSNNRKLTEFNITNIVNRLVDKDFFVISPSLGDTITDETSLEFNIKGYWVKATPQELGIGDITNNTNIYVALVFNSTNDIVDNISIEVVAANTDTGTHNGYDCLLKEGKIPEDAYIRFTSDSISLDDGDLD